MILNPPSYKSYPDPVLIICFNRKQYIQEQLESLRLVKPKKIYLACDGPRLEKSNEEALVDGVKQDYLKGIDWECEVQTRFSDTNQGCSLGPINAMTWFFEHEEQGVILEDDIIPNKDFYDFVSVMLKYFKEDHKVLSISGCTLGYESYEGNVFFSKMMNMWGWATWKDRFEKIDFNLNSWKGKANKKWFLHQKLSYNILDYDKGWIEHWLSIFNKTVSSEEVSWWDYQFIYNQIEMDSLTVFPPKNLTKNLGFGSDATHTIDENLPMLNLNTSALKWPITISNQKKTDRVFYEKIIKEKWSFYKRPNWKYYLGKIVKR